MEASGGFAQTNQVVNADFLAQEIDLLPTDQCDVSVSDLTVIPDFDEGFEFPDIPFEFISAGQTIGLSGAAGSYGELTQVNDFGILAYETETELSAPAPDPIIIDITGEVFPAFSNIQIARPDPVSGLNIGSFDPVTASTVFTWDAAPTSNSLLDLSLFSFSFGDGSNPQSVSVDCFLPDDGLFSLPSSTVAELDAALGNGWTIDGAEFTRSTLEVLQQGTALLIVSRDTD